MPDSFPIETSADAVAAILRTRTKDDDGNESGVFSADTRPTLAQVEEILAEAKRVVVSAIGTDEPCEQDLADTAATLAHQRAVLMIELSYFPEQINTNRSPYDQIKSLYDQDIKSLVEAVAERCGTGIGEPGVSGQLPLWDYPNSRPMGMGTVW